MLSVVIKIKVILPSVGQLNAMAPKDNNFAL